MPIYTKDAPPCVSCRYSKLDGAIEPCIGNGRDSEGNNQLHIMTTIKCECKEQHIHHGDYFTFGTIKAQHSMLELGTYKDKNVFVYCPDGFYRKGNIQIFCDRYNIPCFDDYDLYVKEIIKEIGSFKEK